MMTPDWSPSSMFDSSMTASNGDNTRRISVKYVRQLNDSVKWWWHPTDIRQVCLTAQWQRQIVDTRLISVKYVWQLNDSVKCWWHPTDLRRICLTAQWQREMVMTPDWSPSSMFDSSMTASNDSWWHPTDLKWWCPTHLRQVCLTAQCSNGDDTPLIKYVWQLNDSVKWWWHPTDLRRICLTAQWQRLMVITPDGSPSNMFDSSMTASNDDDTWLISVMYVRQLNDSVKWWWHPTDLRQVCLTAQWQRQIVMTPDWSPSNMFDSSTASNLMTPDGYVWQLNDSVKWWWHPTDLRQVCSTAQWQRQMVMTPDGSTSYVRQLNSVKWWWHPTDLRQICLTAQWQRKMMMTPDASPSICLTAQWQRQMVMTPDWSPSNMFDSSMTASNDDDTRRIYAEYVWQLTASNDTPDVCLTAQWQRQMMMTPAGSTPNMFDSSMTASNGDTRRISVKYVRQLNDSVKWWCDDTRHPTDLRQICLTAQWQRQMVMTPDGSPSSMFDSQWQRQIVMTPDWSPSNMFDSSMTASNADDTRRISAEYVWHFNDSVKWWWHPTDLRQICLTAQWQRQMVITPDGSPSNMFDSSMTASNDDDTRLISVKYVWQLNDSVKWW